ILRQNHSFSESVGTQMVLPMALQNIEIPASISVPYRSADGKNELMWTSFEDATFAEFKAYIELLRTQIAADTGRLQAMLSVLGAINPDSDDPSETMGAIFQRLFARGKNAA
ncbi:MAG: hypothetical protein GY832_23820, partial [Chloroflexi bacterium]|nr:hypothetical protein [Chloroflexota bacterium]